MSVGRFAAGFFGQAARECTDLAIEILALRQQLAVLNRERPRPSLNSTDR
jgi:hypothetical protein